jgi:hypothetical protein
MKPKPPKAKRTLADFIRGDAASPDLNGVEDNGDVLGVGIEKLVEGRQADVESANGESGGSGQAHRELSGRELAGGELKRSRQGGGDQADGGGSARGLVEAKENPAEAFLEAIAGLGDRVIRMANGLIHSIVKNEKRKTLQEIEW